jgi:hypothetical protein
LEEQGVDDRIILKLNFKTWAGAWAWLFWLRRGTGGEVLWIRFCTIGLHKMRGNFLTSWQPVIFSRRTLLHGVSYEANINIYKIFKNSYKWTWWMKVILKYSNYQCVSATHVAIFRVVRTRM